MLHPFHLSSSIDSFLLSLLVRLMMSWILALSVCQVQALALSVRSKHLLPSCQFVFLSPLYRYQKGTIPEALHVPNQTAFTLDGRLTSTNVKDFLDEYRYQVKVIVDTSNSHAGLVRGWSHWITLRLRQVCRCRAHVCRAMVIWHNSVHITMNMKSCVLLFE